MRKTSLLIFVLTLVAFALTTASVFATSSSGSTPSFDSSASVEDEQIKQDKVNDLDNAKRDFIRAELEKNGTLGDATLDESTTNSENDYKPLVDDYVFIELDSFDDRIVNRFQYDGQSIIYAFLEIYLDEYDYYDKTRVGDIIIKFVKFESPYDGPDDYWYNDDSDYYDPFYNPYTTINKEKVKDGYYAWFLHDQTDLEEGEEYGFIVENCCDYKYYVAGPVTAFREYSNETTLRGTETLTPKARKSYYFYELKAADETCLPYVKSVKSSKTAVATGAPAGNKVRLYAKKTGKCFLTIELMSGETIIKDVVVKNGNPKLKYTHVNIETKGSIKNKVLYNNKKVKWSSTNRRIAIVKKNGKIIGKKAGKCYIKARVAGKTLKCKVEVGRPDFYSELVSYNTRSNTFYVRIRNYGKHKLKIYSSKAVAKDCDYKTFDRRLKLKGGRSSITIKPGRTKKVGFKVKGRPTWYDVDDFDVYFYFKYDGKKYKCWVDRGECGGYKVGRKWNYTMQ